MIIMVAEEEDEAMIDNQVMEEEEAVKDTSKNSESHNKMRPSRTRQILSGLAKRIWGDVCQRFKQQTPAKPSGQALQWSPEKRRVPHQVDWWKEEGCGIDWHLHDPEWDGKRKVANPRCLDRWIWCPHWAENRGRRISLELTPHKAHYRLGSKTSQKPH